MEPRSILASNDTLQAPRRLVDRHDDHTKNLDSYLRANARDVDACLNRLLPAATVAPTTVHSAMRYSVFGGGKRIRPALTLAGGEAFGAPRRALFPVASAVEMVHTGSLIHDDLPAMDDDNVRRGRPSCHRVFGEAIAILAGTALLTCAFHVLATACEELCDTQRNELIAELSASVGTIRGLIGGQAVDLDSEGKAIDAEQLMVIHGGKTSALIEMAVVAGGIVAGAKEAELRALRNYAKRIGLAFQIIDDILDVTASSEQLGKTAGKDLRARKATYPALYGVDKSRRMADALVNDAILIVRSLDLHNSWLEAIAQSVTARLS
jgi:geranylgeranyl diphosphate synthase, type II